MKRAGLDRERLLFRRQFVLGPDFVDAFQRWKRIEVRPSIRLTVHPDLPAHQVSGRNNRVVLLGFILDPNRPEDRDVDILHRLSRHLEEGGTRESFIRLTYPLGGRWILTVDANQARWLLNDACGYRQVFYSRPPSRPLWAASQPGILAEQLKLSVDQDALAFLRAYRKRNPQYWWPVESSPYKEVYHLLPNHYLDVETGTCHRYWPDRDLLARPVGEVMIENAQLLQRLIESASHRFKLALSITAGGDTRLLLAASKEIRSQLYYFTLMYWDLNSSSPDIRIPATLLARLGLAHHVIRCPSRMAKELREVYRRNVTTARDVYGVTVEGLYNHYPENRVCIKGNAIPIAKNYYRSEIRRLRPKEAKGMPDSQTLAWLTDRQEQFAIDALDRWLAGTNHTNVDALDLFWWEDREGNWQAMSQLEWDMVQEIFVPYNCRLFLTNMLSVPERYRWPTSHVLRENLTSYLWPEVLSLPVNPTPPPTVITAAIDLLDSIHRKVSDTEPRASYWMTNAQRAFQRHPWLTPLERIR